MDYECDSFNEVESVTENNILVKTEAQNLLIIN